MTLARRAVPQTVHEEIEHPPACSRCAGSPAASATPFRLVSTSSAATSDRRRGVAANALDPEAAARLWVVSEEMLNARLNAA